MASMDKLKGFVLTHIEFQHLNSIAYTLSMNSSNEGKPVRLLALGMFSIILARGHSF